MERDPFLHVELPLKREVQRPHLCEDQLNALVAASAHLEKPITVPWRGPCC